MSPSGSDDGTPGTGDPQRTLAEMQRMEEVLRARARDLEERIKERDCLAEISQVLARSEADWASSLQRVADLVPGGFQYPAATVARLELDGEVHASRRFDGVTEPCLAAAIHVEGVEAGRVDVCLVEPPPAGADDFLPEERQLLGAVAERIGEAAWRRRAAAELRRSEAYYRALTQKAGVVIGVTDERGRVRDVGEEVRALLGREPRELRGVDVLSLLADGERERAEALLAETLERPGEALETQVRLPVPGGGERIVDLTVRNLLADPAIGGLVVTVRDVTDRVLQERQIQLQADLLDAVGQAIVSTDLAGRVTYWNRAAEALYGWTRDEVMGRPILDITPTPAGAEAAARDLRQTCDAARNGPARSSCGARTARPSPRCVTDSLVRDDGGERRRHHRPVVRT